MPRKKTRSKSSPRLKRQKNIFLRFIGFFVGLSAVLTFALVLTTPDKSSLSKITSVKDLGTFSGVLPCADCEGIKKSITFNLSGDEKEPHTYSETSVYMGKNTIINTDGTWEYTTSSFLPDAIIIGLSENNSPQSKEYFMVADENTLIMLDRNKNIIKGSTIPLVLKKQN